MMIMMICVICELWPHLNVYVINDKMILLKSIKLVRYCSNSIAFNKGIYSPILSFPPTPAGAALYSGGGGNQQASKAKGDLNPLAPQ